MTARKRKPVPTAPGWVPREAFLTSLCVDAGMTRAEARKEVRILLPEEVKKRKATNV